MVDLLSAQIGGSVSANAASAALAAEAADFTSKSFGLAMRFTVTFTSGDGTVTRLGEWSSCKGLKVEFKTEAVKQGGLYDHEEKLPTQATYGPVVLERAMEQQDSQKLQAWLGKLAAGWVNYSEAKKGAYPLGQVTITLQDAHQKQVASWTLLHAYPSSWSGPALDAKGSTVAIETLTLEHQGFIPSQSAAARMARLGLETGNDPESSVVFQYNPAAIVISHTAPMQQSPSKPNSKDGDKKTSNATISGGTEEVAKANGVTSVTVRSVTFDGPNVEDTCMRLLNWTYPVDVKQSNKKSDLPRLTFSWGWKDSYLVNLNQVTINYTRFSANGKPVRATVDLTLHSVPDQPRLTNPTSGGLSGRRTHLLVGPETLPELATRTYGQPGRWREIATANGIADPLRVRPGTLVYLPGEQDGE